MDADPEVKRLHCLCNRRQAENQATLHVNGHEYEFLRFSVKCTALPLLSRGYSYNHNLNNKHQHTLPIFFIFSTWRKCNFDALFFFSSPHISNPISGIFVWKNVQREIRCFTAIIANKIISTSGRTQYCTNMTPSHPEYDGVTAPILSVNMNWTTKIHRIHAAIPSCIQIGKHALVYCFSSKYWILLQCSLNGYYAENDCI